MGHFRRCKAIFDIISFTIEQASLENHRGEYFSKKTGTVGLLSPDPVGPIDSSWGQIWPRGPSQDLQGPQKGIHMCTVYWSSSYPPPPIHEKLVELGTVQIQHIGPYVKYPLLPIYFQAMDVCLLSICHWLNYVHPMSFPPRPCRAHPHVVYTMSTGRYQMNLD